MIKYWLHHQNFSQKVHVKNFYSQQVIKVFQGNYSWNSTKKKQVGLKFNNQAFDTFLPILICSTLTEQMKYKQIHHNFWIQNQFTLRKHKAKFIKMLENNIEVSMPMLIFLCKVCTCLQNQMEDARHFGWGKENNSFFLIFISHIPMLDWSPLGHLRSLQLKWWYLSQDDQIGQ